jgi:DNA gyrase subunit A
MLEKNAIALDTEARRRYLHYALSVITSRALPDVRDGLKPVQRRILFDMWNDLRLLHDGRFRKCAAVVGDVLGKYHPHGDSSVYDALVRMAQSFSLRYPLVDGHGNFGSLDGDSAAAMRYTECRLQKIATDLCSELRLRTVDWRPNYDGTRSEPVVLPARLPHLLINGSSGIAVGMATSIPPHNLAEVVDAAIGLVDKPELEVTDLLRWIKGPDFPTGAWLLATRPELEQIYSTGGGTLKLRGEYIIEAPAEPNARGAPPLRVIVTSIPYGVSKSTLVEKIADAVIDRKLMQLVDVRDESTDDVRIVLELRKGADPSAVMAWLFRHTPLQATVQINLTCLVPTEDPQLGKPERLDLKQMLRYFLDFRLQVVTRRLEFELQELDARIHILQGLEILAGALDEAIAIIRASEGKADAAVKLIARFALDDEQADAILELKLHRIARMELAAVLKELEEKAARARELEELLASPQGRWALVRQELVEVRKAYADKRRTRVGAVEEIAFDPDAYVMHEDAQVVMTRDGWLKRVREVKDVRTTRVREGDEVMAVLPGNTKEALAFFTNQGSAYVCRFSDIAPSTGYGEPIQKLFKFSDGEQVVAAMSLDPRHRSQVPDLLAVSVGGFALRFPLDSQLETTTRTGRRFAKVVDGDAILAVVPVPETAIVVVASRGSHVLQVRANEVPKLLGPGRGATLLKLETKDKVLGLSVDAPLVVETGKGKRMEFPPSVRSLSHRGGKGRPEARRDGFAKVIEVAAQVPESALGSVTAGGGTPGKVAETPPRAPAASVDTSTEELRTPDDTAAAAVAEPRMDVTLDETPATVELVAIVPAPVEVEVPGRRGKTSRSQMALFSLDAPPKLDDRDDDE